MLASPSDLNLFLQRTVDSPTATLLLSIATSAIQSAVGQTLTYVADDVVDLVVTENRIILPQRPVVDVTAVQGLTGSEWVVVQDVIMPVYLLDGGINSAWASDSATEAPWWSYVAQLPWPLASVTYSHGFQTIPDDLRGICLTVAGRMASNPVGLTSEQVANVSFSYAQMSTASGFSAFEQAVIDKYRRQSGTLRLLSRPMHTDQF